MQCDFNPLASAKPKIHIKNIKDLVNGQSAEVKKWILNVDAFLTEKGCVVKGAYEFTYTLRKSKKRICRIYISEYGCFITPGVNHLDLANPNSITVDMLPESIIDIMKSSKECTKCKRSHDDGPFTFIHNGEIYFKCRFAEFKIDLNDEENRELVRKWFEMELAM